MNNFRGKIIDRRRLGCRRRGLGLRLPREYPHRAVLYDGPNKISLTLQDGLRAATALCHQRFVAEFLGHLAMAALRQLVSARPRRRRAQVKLSGSPRDARPPGAVWPTRSRRSSVTTAIGRYPAINARRMTLLAHPGSESGRLRSPPGRARTDMPNDLGSRFE